MEIRGKFRWVLNAGVFLALASGLTDPASAQVEQWFRYQSNSDVVGVSLKHRLATDGSQASISTVAGRYNGQYGGSAAAAVWGNSFFMYCSDINHVAAASETLGNSLQARLGTVDAASDRLRRVNYAANTNPGSPALYYVQDWGASGGDNLDLDLATTNFDPGAPNFDFAQGAGLASALGETRWDSTPSGSTQYYNDYLNTSLYEYDGAGVAQDKAGGPADGILEAQKRASMASWLTDSFLLATEANFEAFLGVGTSYSYAQFQGAVQIALWEVVQDGYDNTKAGTWDTDTLNLVRDNATSFQNLGHTGNAAARDAQGVTLITAILNKAYTYAGNLATVADSYASTDNTWIQTRRSLGSNVLNHAQDFTTTTSGPIPEPAFYQMAGLLAMGIVGLRRLRKKS